MNYFYITETILIAISWILIMLWIFRPKSKTKYNKYSKIPLKKDDA